MNRIFLYDGTFDGLLTAVFESYRLKVEVQRFVPEYEWQETLFDAPITVSPNEAWAERVRKGLERKTSAGAVQMLYRCFLSELPDVELLIYQFVRLAMASTANVEEDYRQEIVLRLHQINKKIGREVHRMHAFVRFQRTKDELYYAVIEPDFDVLTLIGEHFEKRYPAQQWLIYDSRRHYGLLYDLRKQQFVTFEETTHRQLTQVSKDVLNEEEPAYQLLWKNYFDSVNIPERRNVKVHLQHVPRRYWKYLPEKGL